MKQHYVSKVILRQWCDADRLLDRYDIRGRRWKRTGPGGVAFNIDVVEASVESAFSAIETHVPLALSLLEDDPKAVAPEAAEILKQCMCLHHIRSLETPELFDTAYHAHIASSVDDMSPAELLEIEHRVNETEFYLQPGSAASVSRAKRASTDGIDQILGREKTRSNLIADMLPVVFDATKDYGVAIGDIEPGAEELVLGDRPALAIDTKGRFGGGLLRAGSEFVMPISPWRVAVLARGSSRTTINADRVELINRLQAQSSVRQLFAQPNGTGRNFVDDHFAAV